MSKWMNINGRRVVFEEGETVLEVASKAGIYIPTLCARPDLPSFGACRLCIIDVEGARTYPNSCTLPAREGMVVRTATPDLQAVRRNVFQLILAEHPSYCIICKEHDECEKVRHGEYKAGRVIGCFTCSNKEICEIREISEYLRIKEIRYPMLYKNLPLERDDPFLVRDYNLCILCARCIRACQDVLGYSAIDLTKRGHDTKVGTISEVSHLESGCVFCGHCIDVCPTGALIARGSTWFGTPDKSVITTCNLCSHGCQMVIDVKWDRVVNVHPPYELSARREYCVKGRFCVPALVNGRDRLKYPTIKRKLIKEEQHPVSWDEVISYTAEKLKSFKPKEIGIIITPSLTDESVFILSKFAQKVSTNSIVYDEEGILSLQSQGVKAYVTTFNSKIFSKLEGLEFLVLQDIYESITSESAEVVLPTTVFTEEDGTKSGEEYMRYSINKAVEPPGEALPSWSIFCRIAQSMELEGFSYNSIKELKDEIMNSEPLDIPKISRQNLEYMGIPLTEKVEEFRLYITAKRAINQSEGKGEVDVQI
ncbi:MAG: molybdopterin-dependent oxidoreductase [Candidatus Hodarchaeales archaeon]|jgi:predicted molibdopterin-dependent oxidoreductase YjgC